MTFSSKWELRRISIIEMRSFSTILVVFAVITIYNTSYFCTVHQIAVDIFDIISFFNENDHKSFYLKILNSRAIPLWSCTERQILMTSWCMLALPAISLVMDWVVYMLGSYLNIFEVLINKCLNQDWDISSHSQLENLWLPHACFPHKLNQSCAQANSSSHSQLYWIFSFCSGLHS